MRFKYASVKIGFTNIFHNFLRSNFKSTYKNKRLKSYSAISILNRSVLNISNNPKSKASLF